MDRKKRRADGSRSAADAPGLKGGTLDAGEIDKERGVILSELISRDSVGYRMMKQQFSELLPDSLLTRRFPIGTN